MRTTVSAIVVLFLFTLPALIWAQAALPDDPSVRVGRQQTQQSGAGSQTSQPAPATQSTHGIAPSPNAAPDQAKQKTDDSEGKQTKRMLGVVPNFAAVSANTKLPPLSTREKFKIASEDSFDYSSFIWAGILAGQSLALNSDPELGHGIAGYGRYYWRAFADQASGAFFTEAIVPALTHEDPRYYTLGHGGFFHRTGYAISQLVLTKTDAEGEKEVFNYSEVVGNVAEAALSNAYYPPQERGFGKTATGWATQMEGACINNIIKEFWPDIRHKVLRRQ